MKLESWKKISNKITNRMGSKNKEQTHLNKVANFLSAFIDPNGPAAEGLKVGANFVSSGQRGTDIPTNTTIHSIHPHTTEPPFFQNDDVDEFREGPYLSSRFIEGEQVVIPNAGRGHPNPPKGNGIENVGLLYWNILPQYTIPIYPPSTKFKPMRHIDITERLVIIPRQLAENDYEVSRLYIGKMLTVSDWAFRFTYDNSTDDQVDH